jgi:ribose transport system permease protein
VTEPMLSASRGRLRLPGIKQVSVIYLLAGIFLLYSLWIPSTFLTSVTFSSVASSEVAVSILALAVLIAVIAGVFDVSVAAMMTLSLATMTWLQGNTHINAVLCCVIAVCACGLGGLLNGLIIVRFGVNSFIVTLGSSQVFEALGLWISQNQQISGVYSKDYLRAGQAEVGGFPIVVFYLLGLALVLWYVLAWTGIGRKLFATGANREAARLAGIHTDRLIISSLVSSAMVAGVAGLVYGAQIGSFTSGYADGLLFPAFAAVYFGATQFKKRPNLWGTLLAVYTLAFGVKGLQLALASGVYWITPMFNGLALLIASTLAVGRHRSRKRALRVEQLIDPLEVNGASAEQVPASATRAAADVGK